MMKFNIIICSILLASFSIMGKDLVGEIRNGYFQDGNGNPAFWNYHAVKPGKIELIKNTLPEGNSLVLDCSGSSIAISQDLHFETNKEYYLTFIYKLSELDPKNTYNTAYIEFSDKQRVFWVLNPPNIYWNKFVATFKAPCAQGRLIIQLWKPGQQIEVGNFTLTETVPIIKNGGFESKSVNNQKIANWELNVRHGKVQLLNSRDARQGENAIRLSGNGTAFLENVVTDIEPANDYQLKFWYKSANKTNIECQLTFLDAELNPLPRGGILNFQVPGNDNWSNFALFVPMPLEACGVKISLGGTLEDKSMIMLDDINLIKVIK